mgnify:CR=1 FL=1
MRELKIFSGRANRPLALKICDFLNLPLGKISLNDFPDGASYAQGVNNEALMVYVFFGKERMPSGSLGIRRTALRSRQRRGTGLGLAIVKHLMRLHGGSVTVESELGHGARFTLHFPDPARRGAASEQNGEGKVAAETTESQ